MKGMLTFRIEGGLKSIELLVSVPSSDLLGVSGFKRELSPTFAGPNIMLGSEAGVDHLLANAFLAPCPET